MIKRMIPNALTMGNLFCGCVAVIMAVTNRLEYAALFVVIGIVFDFFDGFAARMLGVTGELGKQLDSLADMVTSGVVPGIVMYQLINHAHIASISEDIRSLITLNENYWAYFGFIITLASAYRLAKFNIDTRQTESFIGLPTPANTLLIISIPLILNFQASDVIVQIFLNKWFLMVLSVFSAYLLNAEIGLFALKFKTFDFTSNKVRYIFLIVAITLLVTLKFIAIPCIIILYVLLSMLNKESKKA